MALILVVDDSSFQRQNIQRVVVKEGHEIIEASNGREAFQVLSQKKVDCILMDLILPKISGFAMLKNLEKQKSSTPIIVITAYIQQSVKKQCEEMGTFAILNKPLNEQELVDALQKALNHVDTVQ